MAIDGTWNLTLETPIGTQELTLQAKADGGVLTGTQSSPDGSQPIQDGAINGAEASWSVTISSPMPMTLEFRGLVDGDTLSGSVKLGMFGEAEIHRRPGLSSPRCGAPTKMTPINAPRRRRRSEGGASTAAPIRCRSASNPILLTGPAAVRSLSRRLSRFSANLAWGINDFKGLDPGLGSTRKSCFRGPFRASDAVKSQNSNPCQLGSRDARVTSGAVRHGRPHARLLHSHISGRGRSLCREQYPRSAGRGGRASA